MQEHNSTDAAEHSSENIEESILKGRDLIRAALLNEAESLLSSLLESNNGYVKLQLANAYLYLEKYNDAIAFADQLVVQAKEERDALLTIAALVTKGEAIIDMVSFDSDNDEVQAAIEAFGKALGVSEFFDDEKMTILPLAGLAHAHWLWGNSKKAAELCERCLTRIEKVEGDERGIFEARAALSLAIVQQSPNTFHKAIEHATLAKHISLKNRIERFHNFYKAEISDA